MSNGSAGHLRSCGFQYVTDRHDNTHSSTDIAFTVLHTPGHTPGSLSYYTDGLLFSGDTLFQGSIGRTDLPGGDYDLEMESIVDRLLTLPDDTIVLPGHMSETKIGFERQANPFINDWLDRRRAGEA